MFYVVGCIMVVVLVLGIAENFAIIYTYLMSRKLRTIDNVFIVGIAVSDMGQAILGVPLVVLSSFSKHWIFGYSSCQYYAFVTTFLGITQVALLTSLAVDRYFIIVRCYRKLTYSFLRCIATITSSFLFGLGWALGPLLGWSSYEEEIKGIACSVSWEIKDNNHLSYTLSLFTFGWFVPLFIICFSYTGIARTIYKGTSYHQQLRVQVARRSARDRKVSVTVFLMIGAFILSWLPYSVVSMWSALGNYNSIPAWSQVTPAVFAKCSIIWNPIIYVARHSCYRKAINENIVCFKNIDLLNIKQKVGRKTTILYLGLINKNRKQRKIGNNESADSNLLDKNRSYGDLAETIYLDASANDTHYV